MLNTIKNIFYSKKQPENKLNKKEIKWLLKEDAKILEQQTNRKIIYTIISKQCILFFSGNSQVIDLQYIPYFSLKYYRNFIFTKNIFKLDKVEINFFELVRYIDNYSKIAQSLSGKYNYSKVLKEYLIIKKDFYIRNIKITKNENRIDKITFKVHKGSDNVYLPKNLNNSILVELI